MNNIIIINIIVFDMDSLSIQYETIEDNTYSADLQKPLLKLKLNNNKKKLNILSIFKF